MSLLIFFVDFLFDILYVRLLQNDIRHYHLRGSCGNSRLFTIVHLHLTPYIARIGCVLGNQKISGAYPEVY